jgi:proteasome lid subunit RPN8/RPN11
MLVLNGHWEDEIKDSFCIEGLFQHERTEFLKTIWEMSQTAFDSPREIQVVLDSNDELFITVGSASFVSFTDENEVVGMKLPVKCWIHTHPFGRAYFSRTDWKTINSWKPIMLTAIVLGDNEHQVWMRDRKIMEHHTYKRILEISCGDEQ